MKKDEMLDLYPDNPSIKSRDMDTIWVDINLGTKEYEEDYSVAYYPEITKRIELTKLQRIVSASINDDFKEIIFQFGNSLKEIKHILKNKENYGRMNKGEDNGTDSRQLG